MLKFFIQSKDNSHAPIIGIGLSDENLKRLKERKPIQFNLQELNIPINMNVLIVSGETEEDIKKMVENSMAQEPKPL